MRFLTYSRKSCLKPPKLLNSCKLKSLQRAAIQKLPDWHLTCHVTIWLVSSPKIGQSGCV